MIRTVSALGDTALLVPLALALVGYILAIGQVRLARDLALTLVLGLGATLAAKLLFNACGGEVAELNVTSPSGHASFAAMVYGALALAFGSGRPLWIRAALGAAAAALVVAIGISRVLLRAHSEAEVILGLAIGMAALACFGWLRSRAEETRLRPTLPLIGAGLVMALFLGRSLTLEHYIAGAARHLTGVLEICTPQPHLAGIRRPRS